MSACTRPTPRGTGVSVSFYPDGHAIGEMYCLVHPFSERSGQRKCRTLGIRYNDQCLRPENRWYFVERELVIDWSDSRISVP
jgi:hypothetical protein